MSAFRSISRKKEALRQKYIMEKQKADIAKFQKEQELNNVTIEASEVIERSIPVIKNEIRNQIIGNMLTMMCFTLHEGFGFGKKRLEDFCHYFIKLEEMMKDKDADYMSQFYQNFKEETKFDVVQHIAFIMDKVGDNEKEKLS